MFITFHALIFYIRTTRVRNCWHENKVCHEIASQGHSVGHSFTIIAITYKG